MHNKREQRQSIHAYLAEFETISFIYLFKTFCFLQAFLLGKLNKGTGHYKKIHITNHNSWNYLNMH